MATYRRRPSALREISKNLYKNDESEDMSASPSPSAWIKQVQQQHSQRSSYEEQDSHHQDDHSAGHKFAFRATNRVREIIDDHEESEMESDYVETEVSEEEIRDIQVPYETEIEESESQSDYTSIADHQSPLYQIPKHRRQSMPNLNRTRHSPLQQQEEEEEEEDEEVENRPPSPASSSPPPPQALHEALPPQLEEEEQAQPEEEEEHKDIEDDSDSNHCGSMNHSLILRSCFEDETRFKKQSILPPKELTFDEMESPAPPSILRTKPSRKKRKASSAVDTPHFADIANNLAGIGDMLHPSEREREAEVDAEDEEEEEEVEPSPLIATNHRDNSRESSCNRKIMTKNVAQCTQNITNDLEQRMQRLKQTLPSPAVHTPVVPPPKKANKRRSARLAQKKNSGVDRRPQKEDHVQKKKKKKRAVSKASMDDDHEEEEEDERMSHGSHTDENEREDRPYIDDEMFQHDPPLPPSHKSSLSRRTRTLRSRKKETLQRVASPISEDGDEDDAAAGREEEDYPTFGTPKSNKRNKRNKNKGKQSKKSNKSNKSNNKNKKSNTRKNRTRRESPNINENEDEKQEISVNDCTPFMDIEEDDDDEAHAQHVEERSDSAVWMEEDDPIPPVEERKVRSHAKDKKKDKKTSTKRTKSNKKSKKEKKTKPKKKKEKKKKTQSKKTRKTRKRKASATELSDSDVYEPDNKRRRLSQYVNPPVDATQAEQTGCRRSKRVRFKPLAFWASERIEYTPTPLTLESVADRLENAEANSIIVGQKNRLNEFTNKRKTKRPSRRKNKAKKKSKKEREVSVSDNDIEIDDDDDDKEEDITPFSGNAWIYDPNTDQMSEKCVVKTDKSLNLVPLSFGNDSNTNTNENNEPISKRVRGAKGLQEEGFSCGVLEIPPESQKHAEVSYFTEQFFVHQSERKKLLFKVGDESEFYLSRGSMFFVPPENEYSLHNLSKTVPVKLIFTLIKQSGNRTQQDAYETQTQVSTTQGTI